MHPGTDTFMNCVWGEGREKRREGEDGQWRGKTVNIKFGKKKEESWNQFVKGAIYKSPIPLTLDWGIGLFYLCSFWATQPSTGKELRFVQQNEKPPSGTIQYLILLSLCPHSVSSLFFPSVCTLASSCSARFCPSNADTPHTHTACGLK